jgi:hypothetical protein
MLDKIIDTAMHIAFCVIIVCVALVVLQATLRAL